jgi:copper chaperone CopZ
MKPMTHTYAVSGMTCSSCEAKVKSRLLSMEDVTAVDVSKQSGTATITMSKPISLNTLQDALGGKDSKYQVSAAEHSETAEQAKSWLEAYKPILLVFFYLTVVSLMASLKHGEVEWMSAMSIFMAGFFLVFSFFKLLNLEGFVNSYAMYDVIAMKFRGWGYIYAFLELALGLAYLLYPEDLLVNLTALGVMSVSIIGVMRSVLKKQLIQCACLGAVFNLPMSTLTIIEDALMIGMSGAMALSICH